jgi:hypothetical protein
MPAFAAPGALSRVARRAFIAARFALSGRF